MKKVFAITFLLACTLVFASCKKDYEKQVDEYYSTHLNDPSSYECISMSDPLQVLTPISLITIIYGDDKDILEKVDAARETLKSEGKDPNEVIGYYVIHKYRANNAFGAKIKQEDVVFFNKEKKIIDVRKRSDLRKK